MAGSASGDTYARAFLDYLKDHSPHQLAAHLNRHYTTLTPTGRCLTYRPGQFTRLPNRYYHFTYGAVDFFGLDSNTFNHPVEVDGAQVLAAESPGRSLPAGLDWQQLFWLRDRLVTSLKTPQIRGRVLFCHHPPYSTEVTKWQHVTSLCVRRHLRWVLEAVVNRLDSPPPGPLVDLVLSGHAHCLEYLRTVETGHGDRHLNWIVCGGSGARLRPQQPGTTTLTEPMGSDTRLVAKSQLFLGRSGSGADTRWPYSFLRIDVQPPSGERDRCQLVIRPFVVECSRGRELRAELTPLLM